MKRDDVSKNANFLKLTAKKGIEIKFKFISWVTLVFLNKVIYPTGESNHPIFKKHNKNRDVGIIIKDEMHPENIIINFSILYWIKLKWKLEVQIVKIIRSCLTSAWKDNHYVTEHD